MRKSNDTAACAFFEADVGERPPPVPDNVEVEANLKQFGLVYSDIPASYKPDSLWSYELGSKADFLKRTLTLNLSAFYLKWKNIQQDLNLSDAGFDFELNGGDATNYGLGMC